jgi:predicted DNA-binding transcriptional regulator AlpA
MRGGRRVTQTTETPKVNGLIERMLSERLALEMAGIGRTTKNTLEKNGDFPKRRLLLPHRIGYLESEVLAWVRSRQVGAPPPPERALRARGIEVA